MLCRKLLVAIPFLLTVISASSFAADINASLSSLEAYVGNPITLQVEVANALTHDSPEIPAIEGVDIRSAGTPSTSSQVTIINGRRSEKSSVTYAWELIPRREGTFVIPAIHIQADGHEKTTRLLRFSATRSQTGDLLFAEIVGGEDHIFVGQPMKLTLRIWLKPYADAKMNVALSEGDMWRMISHQKSNWGMFSDRIDELAANNQRPGGQDVLRLDGHGVERQYFLYEIEATVYPKRPGHIDGGELQIVVDYPTRLGQSRDRMASLFDRAFPSMLRDEMPSMFGPRLSVTETRPIAAGAEVNATDVLPVPTAGRPADYQGAIGRYEIVTEATPTQVRAGDPITLHLGIQGDGPLDQVQAPPLSLLSELTNDFKVADDALAGIVHGHIKLFTVSIRPRREGITHIPAIPFSYFDTSKEEFVTVHSSPISINVRPADQLAFDAIMGRTIEHSATTHETDVAPALTLTNFDGDQLLVSVKPTARWPLILAIILPPLAWMTTWAVRNRRLIINWYPFSSAHDRETLRGLRDADSPGDISKSLLDFVQRRVGKSALAWDFRMDSVVNSELAEEFDRVIQKCEQLNYAGLNSQDVAVLASDAAVCVQHLSAELPALPSARTVGWKRRKLAAVSTLLLGVGAILFVGERDATASELSATQQSRILAEADAAYRQGQQLASKDSAESKLAYERAAQKYQTLVDQEIVNDRLYFNLGNAYLQTGSLGLAIGNYERAIAVNPSSVARDNLVHVRSLLAKDGSNARASKSSEKLAERIVAWNDRLPVRALTVLGLAAWTLIWLTLWLSTANLTNRLRALLIPAAILVAICAASQVVRAYGPTPRDKVVIVVPQVTLKKGSGEAFDDSEAVVAEGDIYSVKQQRDGWFEVESQDSRGWVSDRDALLVRRSKA